MNKTEFIHLHNHSEYSLLDGLIKITDGKGRPSAFLKHLSDTKIPALAITDHGNMYGAVDFYFACRSLAIKPIIGCEVYIAKNSRKEKGERRDNGHLTLLAKDFQGYENLMSLVSDAFLTGFHHNPRIDLESLAKYYKGLIGLSGCLKGHISQACLNGDIENACSLAEKYGEILGKDNFYIELMDHGIPEEQQAMKGLLEVAKKTGFKTVATNDCHYPKKEDWQAQDINICIRTGRTLNDPDRLKISTKELYYKSPEEMVKLFAHTPEAVKNTLEIAEKCNVEIPHDKFILPHFDLPQKFKKLTLEEYLEQECEKGLKEKLGKITDEYNSRLKFELKVINKMKFPAYFLIVSDFIKYARSKNIPVGPGRGSGAGSLVAYALDITRVDPIKNGLLFERFLNPDRLTMPDLDIDFSDDGRAEVIEYVKNKYGESNVAQIVTFGTIKAKLAIRDTARVMGFTPTEANRIAKLVPFTLDTTIYSSLKTVPELAQIAKEPKIKELLENAQKIEGLKRHTGVHAAGIVVTRDAVTKYTPLARGSREITTTQYEGETLVKLGLLKIDFLGLRTLTVIDTTINFIKKLRNKTIDIQQIPADDDKTYKLLRSGKTSGVFQLESRGMRDLVKSLKPTQFSDISALVALYRPGPMQSGMLDLFVQRKHGKKKVTYDHPLLEPVLKETYGTMVYQEQVMEIAKKLGGFTPGKADTLRKAMGKKLLDVMESSKEDFLKGCENNKISHKIAAKIFDQMAQFAAYGFNKSHSVAYALIAYQTAFLKANYPIEFMTSLLISEIGKNAIGSEDKENKIVTYIQEARSLGIEVLAPDVNKSDVDFSVEENAGKESIRFGLRAVKNVGSEAALAISKAAKENGGFASLEDLCSKTDLKQISKKTLESLAKAGAFDSVYTKENAETSRSYVLGNIDDLLASASKIKQEQLSGQGSLFGQDIETLNSFKQTNNKKNALEPLAEHTLLSYEKEVLGFYFSGHPLARYENNIKIISPVSIEKLHSDSSITKTVKAVGLIEKVKQKTTKRKENWASFELEDMTASMNINVFPKNFNRLIPKLKVNTIAVVTGKINRQRDEAEIFAEDIISFDDVLAKHTKALVLKFSANISDDKLKQLNKFLSKRLGNTAVYLKLQTKDAKTTIIKTKHKIKLTKDIFSEIDDILGKNSCHIKTDF